MGKRVKFTVYADSQSDLDRIRKTYANDTRVIMKCQACFIPVSKVLNKIIGKSFSEMHCRKCGILLGTFNKYGVINVFQLKSTKETMKKTCLEKYGVENASQSDLIKEKRKAALLSPLYLAGMRSRNRECGFEFPPCARTGMLCPADGLFKREAG